MKIAAVAVSFNNFFFHNIVPFSYFMRFATILVNFINCPPRLEPPSSNIATKLKNKETFGYLAGLTFVVAALVVIECGHKNHDFSRSGRI